MVAHFLIKGLGEDEGGHKHVEIKWLLLIKQHSVSSLLQGPRSHPQSPLLSTDVSGLCDSSPAHTLTSSKPSMYSKR